MIYFTSDHHFGHENIIKHCKRPFSSVTEMDDHMVEAWNSVVGKRDTVYHLGDISHKRCDPEYAEDLVCRLNGSICLIIGNHEVDHDPDLDSRCDLEERMLIPACWFSEVVEGYYYIREEGQLITMSHYAQETWHDMSKGTWHLHGHSHGKLKKKPRRLDVGVDSHNFKPWSLTEIQQHFQPNKETAF